MKNLLNKYRQYTLTDYLLKPEIFKEYLEFCKTNNLSKEKKYIFENLFLTLQYKDNSGNEKLISELQKLIFEVIIYSDFEMELLFESELFNPELQKKLFKEFQKYINKNENLEYSEEQVQYIKYKINYWKLKIQNLYMISLYDKKESILEGNEIRESFDDLIKYINIFKEKDGINNENKNKKCFLLKILYEVCIYSYFKQGNNFLIYLELLIQYYNAFVKIYPNDKKNLYFDIYQMILLSKYFSKYEKIKGINIVIKEEKQINISEENQPFINEDLFALNDINNCDNVLYDDYNNFKDEIDKTKNLYFENLNLNNNDALNNCDINNKNWSNSFSNCINISKLYIDKTLDNYIYYNIGEKFVNSILAKIKNYKGDNNDIQYIKKEITYYAKFFDIAENIIKNESKLKKNYFVDFSNYMAENSLTDNLRLSGLIHCYMINFEQNSKTLKKYLEGCIDFIKNENKIYGIEVINQIQFILIIFKIFYSFSESKDKWSFDKENKISITEELSIQMVSLFVYWLNYDDSSIEENKKGKRKNLKFNTTENIIFIMIESLKNIEHLKILKIIICKVIFFLVYTKHLNENEQTNELFDYIYQTNPKLFMIDKYFDCIMKNIKMKVNDDSYLINLKFDFMGLENKNEYSYNIDLLNFYITNLFQALKILNNKIHKYESLQKNNYYTELNQNLIDYYTSEITNIKKEKFYISFFYMYEADVSDKEVKEAIINGINYLQHSIKDFKIEYMKNDLMNDNTKAKKLYPTFKSKIKQEILYQLILCFVKYKKNLEALILMQYIKNFDTDFAYKLLQNIRDKKEFINIDSLKYIWKIVIFEYLGYYFNKIMNTEALSKIKNLIGRASNHQYFKGHPLRKNFKIVNFFNFLDYLNNIKYKF